MRERAGAPFACGDAGGRGACEHARTGVRARAGACDGARTDRGRAGAKDVRAGRQGCEVVRGGARASGKDLRFCTARGLRLAKIRGCAWGGRALPRILATPRDCGVHNLDSWARRAWQTCTSDNPCQRTRVRHALPQIPATCDIGRGIRVAARCVRNAEVTILANSCLPWAGKSLIYFLAQAKYALRGGAVW